MQASTSYSCRAVAAAHTGRVCSVRVQAAAQTAAGGKTVMAPPYNVLITGSTKGVCCNSAHMRLEGWE